MEEPGGERRPDLPFGEAFSEIPLFREIQRVLLSSAGGVNWELARQVAIATSTNGAAETALPPEDQRGFEQTVRATELHVAELTGLPAPGEVSRVRVLRRTEWVAELISDLKEVVEPTAARLEQILGGAQGEAPEGAPMAQAVLGQIVPLLLGAQVGMVVGYLGRRALSSYDIALPRSRAGDVSFVGVNVAEFEREWSLPSMEFRAWVALHEVVHRLHLSQRWVRPHFVSLVADHASTLELDLEDLRTRMEGLDIANPEALQGLLEGDGGLFGSDVGEEQRLKLARVQSFMAAAEGYGEHVTDLIGERLLGAHAQIKEAVRRHREGEAGDPLFERLLGIEVNQEQYGLGRAFCELVVELTDESTLSRMWESAEALPSAPELAEPRLWLARMA
jgi:putative hydrolase